MGVITGNTGSLDYGSYHKHSLDKPGESSAVFVWDGATWGFPKQDTAGSQHLGSDNRNSNMIPSLNS